MASGSVRMLALQASLAHLDALIQGVAGFQQACLDGARLLASLKTDPATAIQRRDVVLDLPRAMPAWRQGLEEELQQAQARVRRGQSPELAPERAVDVPLTLMDDQQVEQDLHLSRLAQSVAEAVAAEWGDLSARLQALKATDVMAVVDNTVFTAPWVLRLVQHHWLQAGLTLEHWATIQATLSQELGGWLNGALHRANEILREHGVRPEINLRPFIRRAADTPYAGAALPGAPTAPGALGPGAGAGRGRGAGGAAGGLLSRPGALGGSAGGDGAVTRPLGVQDETRLLTQTANLQRHGGEAPQQLLGQLAQTVARQVPGFAPTATPSTEPVTISSGLIQAMGGPVGQAGPGASGEGPAPVRYATGLMPPAGPTAPMPETAAGVQVALKQLQEGKQTLKRAAATPAERATIEVVALMFQSILMEERLPASIRVWFARLQMPVLRVAVSEPDFFASVTHPARVLIDRMGACVLGFVASAPQDDDALHREIKRVVQVVEAYPETGRRVFQTVLNEFERFLDGYFREHNAASREGVSLAQQVEQRETWAIQYTIELRKMLERLPVHEGVRHFLFQVWADVMAHGAVRHGPASEATKALKAAAGDLIWSASAKTSREERAEVLRRLPPLLKTLRDGMVQAGLSLQRQDEEIQALNTALAAAFSARAAALSPGVLQEVMASLEALDELLPGLEEVELDDDLLRDLSGHDSEGLEVVAQGGTMPTPAMLGWARELQVGAWFTLDYRGRQEPVQLAWRGLHKQLILFARPTGPAVLFQLDRLAAFLQAGLLLPLEEESLTTRATRQALTKLEVDPSRLLS
jgi:hypothetical protein